MLDILVCHAASDRDTAEKIAGRLTLAEANVWLDETGCGAHDNIATAWEGGQSYAAIVLVLSPDSTPPVAGRTAWQPVLDHRERHAHPPMAIVLARECSYPRILERKDFFRWEGDRSEALRAIGRWAVSLHETPGPPALDAAPLPWVETSDEELALLWEELADTSGIAIIAGPTGSGKTALAQEFARRARPHFRDVLWVACGEKPPEAIAGEIAGQLGTGFADLESLTAVVREHRVLIVLDDATHRTPLFEGIGGRASVLATTRLCALGSGRVVTRDRIRLLEDLRLPADPHEISLWRAMAVCRPQDVPVTLAGEIAGLGVDLTRSACGQLAALRLADPLDRDGARIRLNALSAAAALEGVEIEPLRRRHAAALRSAFARWTRQRDRCRMLVPEVDPALRWAAAAEWPLAAEFGQQTAAFLAHEGRGIEAAGILRFLRDTAATRLDSGVVQSCTWQLSWMEGTLPDGSLAVGDQLQFEF